LAAAAPLPNESDESDVEELMAEITVVGGGIAGLTAAITAADAGGRVRLLEARAELGGRARTSPAPHRANLGPHALYTDGALWQWLETERLLPDTVTRGDEPLLYRHQGELAARPPALRDAVAKILAHPAPPEAPFRDWATSLAGPEASELLVGLAFVFTFDYDPGRLSAAFIGERLRRVVNPGLVRYIVGGWQALVEQLTVRAAQAGVIIEMRSRARKLPALPVVVATPPAAARRLLGAHVHAIGTRVGLTDIALATEAPLPSGVLDLDERLYLARYTAFDRTLAPPSEELIQIVAACQPHERTEHVQARIDRLLDQVAPGWRGQLRWSRRSLLADATGALDHPCCDRNARPTISQGSGIFIAGDYVAAPGLLSEVSFASGRQAGLAAAAFAQRRSPRNLDSARSQATSQI
jgi:phytoene dehydrogenase-like protein